MSIVLAQYLFAINGHSPTAWEQKGVAIAGYTVAFLREFSVFDMESPYANLVDTSRGNQHQVVFPNINLD